MSPLTLAQFSGAGREARLRDVIAARAEQRRIPVLLRDGIGLTVLTSCCSSQRSRGDRRPERARSSQARSIHSCAAGGLAAGIDISPHCHGAERTTLRVVSWSLVAASIYLGVVFVLQQFLHRSSRFASSAHS